MLGAFTGGATFAQYRVTPSIVQEPVRVLSGSDIGFRVEGRRGASVVGSLVARIDGAWVDVDTSAEMKRLTTK